jgi:xanthine dehydrogenase YagS FAD-binding subunit
MNFDLAWPDTIDEALSAKSRDASWFAGGTEILPEIKTDLRAPARLINLKALDALRGIDESAEGIRIGALTTLAQVAEDERIKSHYRALAQACDASASPQIRNAATLGGNLNQDSRCAYWRTNFPCYLHGGAACFMRAGENREGAVIGYRDCVHVHPSDPATALVALDARIITRRPEGGRELAASDFFRAPTAADTRMNVLDDDELITAILLPSVRPGLRSAYQKAMDRATWAFALTSAAVMVVVREGRVTSARIAIGGVAPTPWRAALAEEDLIGAEWGEAVVTQVTSNLLADAQPLSQNKYKVRLARAMVKRALADCLN